MGTTYELATQGKLVLSLDEHSNQLDIAIGNDLTGREVAIRDLTPEQTVDIALEMLKVCSYWSEDGTIERKITEFKQKGYHW